MEVWYNSPCVVQKAHKMRVEVTRHETHGSVETN
jgi:hypothetical protein